LRPHDAGKASTRAMISTPWAILLCKMKDIPDEPHKSDFYELLFCQQGAGKGGLFDYWQQISYNALDLSGSQVFGWFQLNHTLEEQKDLTLDQQLERIYAVAKGEVDFKSFHGFVAVYNFPTGSGGQVLNANYLGNASKTYGFAGLGVQEISPLSPSCAAHEMGHGYGLDHSWGIKYGMDVGYGDPWDIMSFGQVHVFTGATFGTSGPGLVAPYLIKKGWLTNDRVLSVDLDTDLPSEIHLTALGHADVEGPLAIRIDLTDPYGSPLTYVIEYRHQGRWDAGIPYDAVLMHEVRANGLSYLLGEIVACERCTVGSFGHEIVVKTIDAQKLQATILICRKPEADLKGEVTTVWETKFSSGTYHFPGNMFCPAKDYLYTQYGVASQAKYEFSVKLFESFEPAAVEYIWRLNGSVLKPPKDYVVLEVSSTAAVPPPVGKTDYHHQAVVSFEISGNTIVLQALPSDANFSVTLRVDVNVAGCLRTYAQHTIDFKGDVLEFEEPYYKDTLRCLMKMRAFIAKKKKQKPKKGPKIPKGPKKLKKKIAEIVHEIVQSEPRLASELQRSFSHIPGVTFRPGLRPTLSRLKKARRSSEWHSSAFSP
jgi:M6 family metalloprotease-like protein